MSQNTIIRKCSHCGVEQSIKNFYVRKDGLGIQSWCISCTKERGRRHRKATSLFPSLYITKEINMGSVDFNFFGKQRQGRSAVQIGSFALISNCKHGKKNASTIYLYENFIKKFRFIGGDRVFIAFDKKNNLLAIKRTVDLEGYTVSQNKNSKNASIKIINKNFIVQDKKYVYEKNIIEQEGVIILDLN